MPPKFGTSGLRGLVTELTPELVADHIAAFAAACPMGTGLWVGRDLRPSSPELAEVVLETARGLGLRAVDCGAVPTPALALAAMGAGAASVMVTGSHIPADRNGLKFYPPVGEITKADEAKILAGLGRARPPLPNGPEVVKDTTAGPNWVQRYVSAFGPGALGGLRLGLWAHSAVSRDLIGQALRAMGAEVVELGRSDQFIPVDTEAVPAETRRQLAAWAQELRLDGVLSTDGDGDRPLLADAGGDVVPGDVLGQITAAALGAECVVTPISSNTGVDALGRFGRVIRCRIGSPFVIAAMEAAIKSESGRVVGYEANGGFLLGFGAEGPAGPLPPLWTRDSLLPLIAVLASAKEAGGIAARVLAEPARFTATDRLENIDTALSHRLIAGFEGEPARLQTWLAGLGESLVQTNRTDGLRLGLDSGRILHMRPSGNAPEFRLYAEAESREAATDLLQRGLAAVRRALG